MANITTDAIGTKARLLSGVIICLFIFFAGCSAPEPMPRIIEVSPHADIEMLAPPVTITGSHFAQTSWIPPMQFEDKTRWHGIVVHHSATEYGDAAFVDYLHKHRGFDGVGYDFIINNGLMKEGYGQADGSVEVSYRWANQITGAHCKVQGDETNYWNEHAIGICLIGNFENTYPTNAQWDSLVKLISFLQNRYNIDSSKIKGHCDIKPTKCPGKNLSLNDLKRRLVR